MKKILPFLIFFALFSCTSGPQEQAGQPIQLDYATLLDMVESDSFTQVNIKDAWHKGQTMATYILVPRQQQLPQSMPKGTVIRTPIKRAVINSSVHAALLMDLDAGNCIAGLADTAYIVSKRIKALLQQGVKDVGNSMQPDLEKLHALKTDAIFVSPFENAGHGAIERLNVPIIECADYMETSPLARAEWMKFYGRLVGKEALADSLFATIAQNYNSLKEKTEGLSGKCPTVFCDTRIGGVWYQPGGASTTGIMIRDAGGDYLWKDNKESGSLALDLESVYAKAHDADIWIIKDGRQGDFSYEQLAADCPQYSKFRPWKERNIWICNTLKVPFFEEVPFKPDLLLQSLIAVFHPEIIKNSKPEYYRHLQ